MSELEHLRAFEQVVRTGSFTAAAERLGISRPAVSKYIARLEMQLGTRLFNRTTRRVHLTAEGHLYFEKISLGVALLEEASDLLRESKLGPTGLIRASSVTLFGKHYIVPLLTEFLTTYPKVSLEMAFDDGIPDFVRQGLDVGITRGSKNDSSLVSLRLYKLRLFLVASPAYLKQYGIPKTPAELSSHRTINIRLPTGELPLWHFERADNHGGEAESEHFAQETSTRMVVAGHFDAVVNCALAGLGITVSHLGAVEPYLATGELKVVLPNYRFSSEPKEGEELYIRYPHRKYLPLKVRVFIDFLIEHFREREVRERNLATIVRYAAA